MPTKLFTKKSDDDRRTFRYEMRLNAAENAAIKHAASVRKLAVADYCRRTALARRADLRYEMETVLRLTQVIQAIRAMHVDLVLRGIEPTAEGFRPVIVDACDAMLRIQK